MSAHSKRRAFRGFFAAIVALLLGLSWPAQAIELSNPKSVKISDEIVITVKDLPANKSLELTVSSRALKQALIVAVPADGIVHLTELPVGHYVLGLREVGAKKFIDMSSISITEVLK